MQFNPFQIVIAIAVLLLISAVAPPSRAQSSNMRVKKTQPMMTTPSTPSMKGEPKKLQVEKAKPKPKKGEQVPRQMLRGRM